MESDGNLYHYDGKQLVGVTILNASQKIGTPSLPQHKRKKASVVELK